ncbi:MAG: hypothetical protein N2255_10545 [Kiritimatiellae bacterium]|nr:hypothetical protein [Kiritimatiellia bacterium]
MNRKLLTSALGIVLGVVGSVLLLHSLWQLGAGWALRITLKNQARAGLPASLDELAPASVAAENNAATILQTAFALIQKDREGPPLPHPLIAEIIQYRLDSAPAGMGRDLRTLDADAKKALREKLRNEPVVTILALLRQAAEKPACNFELDLAQGPAVLLPHLAHMRAAVRLLVVDAWVRAEAGDLAGCFENLRVALALSRHLGNEALLFSQIVRINCDSLVIGCLYEILSRTEPRKIPTAQARTLFAELYRHLDPRYSGFVRALDGERICFGSWFFRRALAAKMSRKDLEQLGIRNVHRLYTTYVWRPLLKMEFRHYLLAMSRYRELGLHPYKPDVASTLGPNLLPRYCLMARPMILAVHKSYLAFVGHQAEINMARLGLALCLHHQGRMAYPENLGELKSLPEPPFDPFTSAPFRYTRTRNGFILHSAGPNGRDDGKGPGSDDLVWEIGRDE